MSALTRNKRLAVAIGILAILSMPIWLGGSAFGQSNPVSYTVNLQYINIQVSYPSEVLPGDIVTIHVQGSAKDSFNLVSLAAQIYYSDGTNLRQLATATVASNSFMAGGKTFSNDIQVTVPGDAPRTSLIAVFSEKVRVASYYYYYDPYAYYYVNYSYPYYYVYYYPAYYYSYSYREVTDNGIAPLSYIKAATPEYVSLQSEYQALQQKLAQAQSDNQKLQQDLQSAQDAIRQKDAAIADLNGQVSSAKATTGTLQSTSLILGGMMFVLGIVGFYLGRRSGRPALEKGTVSKS